MSKIKPLAKVEEPKHEWHCQLCSKICPELRDVWPHLHIDHNIELGTLRLSASLEFVYNTNDI